MKYMLVVLALLLPLTSHADQDRKEKGKIAKAERTLKQVDDQLAYMQKMLADAKGYKEGLPPAVVKRIDEKFPKLEETMTKADDAIKEIDAAPPELAERLAKARAAAAELQKEIKGTGEKLAAEDSDLAAGFETDRPRAEAIRSQLDDISAGLRSDSREKGWLDNWPQVQKDAQDLIAKYNGKKASSTAARWMVSAVAMLEKQLAQTLAHRDAAVKDIPPAIDKSIAEAKKYADQAVAAGQFLQFPERVQPLLMRIEALAYIYATITKDLRGGDPSIAQKIATASKELNELQAKHEAKIIEANVVPVDAYQGADRTALIAIATKAFATDNANAKALQVRFTTTGWTRAESWNWDASRSAWYKRDESSLGGVVFAKSADGNQAWAYPIAWNKNHLAGDKVGVNYLTLKGKPESPFRIFPIAKLK